MDKRELKKANGDVYFQAEYLPGKSCLALNWIGIQSLETIMLGANLVLTMLNQRPVATLLNSNKELIGPWDEGAIFMGNSWAPKIKKLGVTRFGQVLGPGIFGKRSFRKFEQLAHGHFLIESFEQEEEALAWLEGKMVS